MPLVLTTQPAAEPLDLATVKGHLRVDVTDDDTLITALITAARQQCEQITNRSLISQGWKYVFDSFPGGMNLGGIGWGTEFSLPDNVLMLQKGPVSAIGAITYLDMSGVQQTMPPTDYAADLSGPLARVTPVFGKIWPIALPQIGACAVTYTAGYPDAASVPAAIKQWMLMRIGAMYENREEVVVGSRVVVAPMDFVDQLLDPYKIVLA